MDGVSQVGNARLDATAVVNATGVNDTVATGEEAKAGVTDGDRPTVTLGKLADKSTSVEATVEENHVDVMELEYAASTGYRVVNVVEAKQPQVSAAMEQAAPGVLTPNGALNTNVDRATPRVVHSMAKGVVQVLDIQGKVGQQLKGGTNNKDGDWLVVDFVQQSSSSKKVPVHKVLSSAAKNITVSNSFDASMNERDLEDIGKKGSRLIVSQS
ncbi:hypothetical protein A4A49_12454 [Nicotiana attenuata]|uniref:Uncharacterized protein n=1 Tax=Nicotiana attenuata TaxID=49451 RepID=A0A314LHM6_NICAT|nr:hypothetical protein A4A49_12454 [Nicotiana attenuata]